LYYWAREAKNSNAELDYIFEKKGMIIPVEVKSGKKGKYKSLKMYIDKYHPVTALKVSQEIYEERDNFISLPFYGIYAFMKE
jgi:predicted AAA+ superfamily ATPase